jgi:hypothetical protein
MDTTLIGRGQPATVRSSAGIRSAPADKVDMDLKTTTEDGAAEAGRIIARNSVFYIQH